MAVAARAVDDRDQTTRRSDLRLERAGSVDRRVRALGTNQLRSGDDGNEDNDTDERDLRASSRHGSPSILRRCDQRRRRYVTTRENAVGESPEIP
jgi:hypothetical protein